LLVGQLDVQSKYPSPRIFMNQQNISELAAPPCNNPSFLSKVI